MDLGSIESRNYSKNEKIPVIVSEIIEVSLSLPTFRRIFFREKTQERRFSGAKLLLDGEHSREQ